MSLLFYFPDFCYFVFLCKTKSVVLLEFDPRPRNKSTSQIRQCGDEARSFKDLVSFLCEILPWSLCPLFVSTEMWGCVLSRGQWVPCGERSVQSPATTGWWWSKQMALPELKIGGFIFIPCEKWWWTITPVPHGLNGAGCSLFTCLKSKRLIKRCCVYTQKL